MNNFNNNSNPMGGAMGGSMGGSGGFGNNQSSFGGNQFGNNGGGAMGGAMGGSMGGAMPAHQAPTGGGIPGMVMPGQFNPHRLTEGLGLNVMDNGGGPMAMGGGVTTGAQEVRIRSVSLGATRPQQTQYRRSYSVFADGATLNKISSSILNSNNGELRTNPMAMAQMLSDPATAGKGVVQYSGGTESSVGIVNEWGTMRYRFVIIAEIWRAGRHTRTEIISGYTDECGVNNPALPNSRSINPAMEFTINSVSTANVPRHHGTSGTVGAPQMVGSSGVFKNPDWVGPMAGSQLYMTRPKDVVSSYAKLDMGVGERDMAASFSGHSGFGQAPSFAGQSMMDIDTVLAGQVQMSSNASALAPTYSARLINGLLNSQLASNDPMAMDDTPGAVTMAAAHMRELNFSNQGFVNAVVQTSRNRIGSDASFTYQDLLRMDPTIDDRCTVYTLARENTGSNLYVPDGTMASNIGESTPGGMASTMIAQGLVGLMLTGGISFISLVATNYNGMTVVAPNGFDGLDNDGMLGMRVQALCDRMKIEVFDIITLSDSGASFYTEIIADAFNDIFIKITLDGVQQDFVYPTFASSSASPVITNNQNNLTTLAGGVRDVVEVVRMAFNEKAGRERPSFGGGYSADGMY